MNLGRPDEKTIFTKTGCKIFIALVNGELEEVDKLLVIHKDTISPKLLDQHRGFIDDDTIQQIPLLLEYYTRTLRQNAKKIKITKKTIMDKLVDQVRNMIRSRCMHLVGGAGLLVCVRSMPYFFGFGFNTDPDEVKTYITMIEKQVPDEENMLRLEYMSCDVGMIVVQYFIEAVSIIKSIY